MQRRRGAVRLTIRAVLLCTVRCREYLDVQWSRLECSDSVQGHVPQNGYGHVDFPCCSG